MAAAEPVRCRLALPASDKLDLELGRLWAAAAPGKLPGSVIALADAGGIRALKANGVADLSTARPMQPDAVFPIASVTKTATALLAVKAAARGKLDLDAPVAPLLPPLHPSAAAQPFTLRQLLTHQSGLPKESALRENQDLAPRLGFDPTIPLPSSVSRAATTRGFAATPLAEPPGTARTYSNIGMDMAARAIETAEGTSMAELVERHITAPLGLPDFTARPTEAQLARMSVAHMVHPKTGSLVAVPTWQPAETVGGTGIYATASSLALYASALIRRTDDALLSDAERRVLLAPTRLFLHREGGFHRQALGWWMDPLGHGQTLWRHNGDADGHTSFLAWSENPGVAVVVLSNGNYSANARLGQMVVEQVLTRWSDCR